jgi:hypothetical protein
MCDEDKVLFVFIAEKMAAGTRPPLESEPGIRELELGTMHIVDADGNSVK